MKCESENLSLGPVVTPWFYELLSAQTADGWFALTEELAENLGKALKFLQSSASLIEGVSKQSTKEFILATVLTVLILEIRAPEHKDQWGMAVKKAKKVLDKQANNTTLDGKPVMVKVKEIFFP